MRGSGFLLVLAATVACLIVPASAQERPQYQSEAVAISIDLVVIDKEGQPVPGLTAGDFEVTVDGQRRNVLSARFVSSATTTAVADATDEARSGELDAAFQSLYAGNQRASGQQAALARTVMIAFDQSTFSVAGGRQAATTARSLLDLLHPNDRVGLVAFPPPGVSVRPTRNHQRVRQALGQVAGAPDQPPYSEIGLNVASAIDWTSGDRMARDRVVETYCSFGAGATCEQELDRAAAQVLGHARQQSIRTLQGLGDVVRAATADGGPAVVVLVSSGVNVGGRATALGVDDEARDLARLAGSSRTTLYGMHVETGVFDRDSMDRTRTRGFSSGDADMGLDGLRYLAGLFGGTVTRVQAGNEDAFRRVSRELSAYYLLGVEGTPSDHDGRRHRLGVRVGRPGLTVRSRNELYLPPLRKATPEQAVIEALDAPDLARDLRMWLSTHIMREPGTDKVRVLVSASIGEAVGEALPVRVGYVIRGAGAEGTSAGSGVQSRTLPLVGAGPDRSFSYIDTIQLTAGRYLLRLAAMDEDGHLGSVQQVVDARLVGGEGGTFSDLLLIDPPRSAEGAFTPVADGRMTGDAVEAFLEVYPAKAGAAGTVAFDLGDAPGRPAIVSRSVTPEKRDDGRLVAAAGFDLRALPPGLYNLEARILDGDRLIGRVNRPFLLERRIGAGGEAAPRVALAFAATGGLVKGFSRDDLLKPDALGYFLNRLTAAETAATGDDVTAAMAALRSSRFDEAMAKLPGQPDVLSVAFLKGLSLLGKGQLEPAAAEFRAALRIANDFLPAAFYLGACYAAGGHDREAVGAWQTSLVSETDSRVVYEVLADALLRLNDGAQAEAIIEEARQRWSDDDLLTPRLAAAKVLQNQRAEALSVLEPYLERHPSDGEPLFLAIRLLYEAHDSGKPLKGADEDRALAQKYGERYREAGGRDQPLIARWVAAMSKQAAQG